MSTHVVSTGGSGALPGTAVVVAQVITAVERVAGQAEAAADRLDADLATLVTALGGGPPEQVREAGALAASAVGALGEAGGVLAEAVLALRAFAARTT